MDTSDPTPAETTGAAPSCYRHPGRETHVRCTRCERYICTDCMRDASVGFHCPECVAEGSKGVREARTAFGGSIRTASTPVVTYALIAITVLAYIAQLADEAFTDQFSAMGQLWENPANGDLYTAGFPGLDAVGIAHGEWYRLITSAFLHSKPTGGGFGILHIAFNMYWLWTLGRVLEGQLGRARFLALYLLAAIGGSLLVYLIDPHSSAIGASGAIFGLAGAYYIVTRRLGQPDTRLLVFFVVWMAISASITSWEGHLGGLIAGTLVALVFAYAPQKNRTVLQIAGASGILLVLLGLTALQTVSLT